MNESGCQVAQTPTFSHAPSISGGSNTADETASKRSRTRALRVERDENVSPAVGEQQLGLPDGAWLRRRLFVLQASGEATRDLGLEEKARLVVEPGCHTGDDQIIVARDGARLTLYRVESDPGGRTVRVFDEPSTLGLTTPVARHNIVGRIIAVLPASQTTHRGGAINHEPKNLKSRRADTLVSDGVRRRNRTVLSENFSRWQRWRAIQPGAESATSLRHAHSIAKRLRILASCLQSSDERHMYEALVIETNRLLEALGRARHRTGPRMTLLETPPK